MSNSDESLMLVVMFCAIISIMWTVEDISKTLKEINKKMITSIVAEEIKK